MESATRPAPTRAQWLKRLASARRERVAIVLSGGGPLGAMQVGALRALFEHSVRPDLVIGTSVGALNATFLAFEPDLRGVEQLEDVWRGAAGNQMFPGGRFRTSWARMLVRGDRIFENTGIRQVVETRLGGARFEDARVPLSITATDLDTGAEHVFSSGPVLDPLLASTAMPGAFAPVEIDGRAYIDGGIAANVPIAPAVQMGAKTVYVIDSTSASHQRRPLNRPIDYLLHAFSLARSQRFAIERRLYEGRLKLVVLPTPPLDFFVPFASLEHTERLIRAAYERTNRFLRTGRADEQDVKAAEPGE